MLKLYTAQVCPFAHRCRLALSFAGLDHERVEIDLANMPDWYRHISPNQKVPLLEHEGHKIWESAIISEYLADIFPVKALHPPEPLLRAKSRLAIDWASNHLIPTFYQVLRNAEEAVARMTQAIAEAPLWMSVEGPFWLGDHPCLADSGIYPWFERWGVLQHYRDLKIDFPPRLEAWVEAMRSHPAVQAESSPTDFYLKPYARYVTPAPV